MYIYYAHFCIISSPSLSLLKTLKVSLSSFSVSASLIFLYIRLQNSGNSTNPDPSTSTYTCDVFCLQNVRISIKSLPPEDILVLQYLFQIMFDIWLQFTEYFIFHFFETYINISEHNTDRQRMEIPRIRYFHHYSS